LFINQGVFYIWGYFKIIDADSVLDINLKPYISSNFERSDFNSDCLQYILIEQLFSILFDTKNTQA